MEGCSEKIPDQLEGQAISPHLHFVTRWIVLRFHTTLCEPVDFKN